MPSIVIEIRQATPEDAPLLAEFGARAFSDAFAADNHDGDMASYLTKAFAADVIASELSDFGNVFLVASEGRALVGYAKLRFGGAPDTVRALRPAELERIYSDPARTSEGIGSALMQASLEVMCERRSDVAWLGVWERNDRAIEFYRRWGFEVVGTQTFVLGSDEQTDFVMARSLGLPE